MSEEKIKNDLYLAGIKYDNELLEELKKLYEKNRPLYDNALSLLSSHDHKDDFAKLNALNYNITIQR